MSRFRLRLLISLLIVSALTLAGVVHAPMTAGGIAADTVMAATPAQPSCHDMREQQKPPVKAHPMPDCCLLFCTSLPAATTPASRPLVYAAIAFVLPGQMPLVPRTLSPEPGPPRA